MMNNIYIQVMISQNQLNNYFFIQFPLLTQPLCNNPTICQSPLKTDNIFCRTQEGPAYTWLFNFHTFGPSHRPKFVFLDQILVPTHSLRDKGTKGQYRNKGTIQEQRDNTGTKEQRNKGTKELYLFLF